MPYRVCPFCNQSSYMPHEQGVWICPYCGKDLTQINNSSQCAYKTDSIRSFFKKNHLFNKK